MECIISSQIAEHCNDTELEECPDCGGCLEEKSALGEGAWLSCEDCDFTLDI